VTRTSSDFVADSMRGWTDYLDQIAMASATPSPLAQMRADLGPMAALEHRADLESIAYGVVRDAVKSGQRPASDLDAARDALKAAQEPFYALQYDFMKPRITQQVADHKALQERLKAQESWVADMEKRLPTTTGLEHDRLEKSLAINKDALALLRKTSRNEDLILSEIQRPPLPILPPENSH